MMIINVPDMNDCFCRANIDGTEYLIRFSWNTTGLFWTFGVYKSKNEPIVASIKIVPNFPLNWYNRTGGMPEGLFAAISTDARIGRRDFVDNKAVFYYFTKEEIDGAGIVV